MINKTWNSHQCRTYICQISQFAAIIDNIRVASISRDSSKAISVISEVFTEHSEKKIFEIHSNTMTSYEPHGIGRSTYFEEME